MQESLYPEAPVIIVDDEEAALSGGILMLASAGIENTLAVSDSRDVISLVEKRNPSALLLDLSMPHVSGEAILEEVVARHPHLPVIVVTGHNDVETAIRCMKLGAFEYLVKPVEEPRLITAVKRALELRELRMEYSAFKEKVLSDSLARPDAFRGFVTNNAKVHALFRYIEAIAPSSRAVLITGETGVGKELIARAIHEINGRQGELVAVNVASLDDNVFSDTLFGHIKGAFTGADKPRRGLVEKAAGGTLFLDEIGDLELSSQAKLLRLLQEKEFYPLGADAARPSDTRVIVATNRALDALQAKGTFRSDLYFRLETHHVRIPPLRERLDDIPLLLGYFLAKAANELGKRPPTAPKELPMLLAAYHFPGNVRELESMVYDAVSHHTAKVLSMESFKAHIQQHRRADQSELPSTGSHSAKGHSSSPFAPLNRLPTLAEAQVMLIEEALRRASNNQTAAAQMLGLTRSGLSKAIKRKKIGQPESA